MEERALVPRVRHHVADVMEERALVPRVRRHVADVTDDPEDARARGRAAARRGGRALLEERRDPLLVVPRASGDALDDRLVLERVREGRVLRVMGRPLREGQSTWGEGRG